MKLILVRHGETLENQLHILQGQTHGKLICFTTDLQRAVDTTNIIASKKQGMKIVKDARLRERYLGELQGKPIPDNWNGMNQHESAEPVEKLIERVKSFLSYIRLNYKAKQF